MPGKTNGYENTGMGYSDMDLACAARLILNGLRSSSSCWDMAEVVESVLQGTMRLKYSYKAARTVRRASGRC